MNEMAFYARRSAFSPARCQATRRDAISTRPMMRAFIRRARPAGDDALAFFDSWPHFRRQRAAFPAALQYIY